MERIIHYTINQTDGSLRTEQYLRRRGFSYKNITQLKKMPESILINGKWSYMKDLLHPGDLLTVHIRELMSSPQIEPVRLPLNIVYEDEDLIVVDKPAGMPTHPSLNNYRNTMANALMWYYTRQGKPFIFRCTNRLDRDTSGLTVIAKHLISASILSTMAVRHEVTREYLAIVHGQPYPESGTINAPLSRAGTSLIERKVDFQNGEHAVTHYKTIKHAGKYSLVSLTLETGRTHQIRVHMKHIGCPLAGDYLYNPGSIEISRQALHSHRLAFHHPITGETMEFVSPLPEDMCTLFRQ